VLAGEKPIMPAPPNVCPEDEPNAEELSLDPLALLVPVVPLAPAAPLAPAEPLAVVVPAEPLLPGVLPEPKIELPPNVEPPKEEPVVVPVADEPPRPPLPLGPTPAKTEPPAEPAPAIGWPKKPVDCVFASPKRIGFQSSLRVTGSMYFLRRKRISLVLTSALALGG